MISLATAVQTADQTVEPRMVATESGCDATLE